MSKVNNEKQKIENPEQFNDLDILQDLLNDEKNISNNLSIALNEMSNVSLYDNIFSFLEDSKDTARVLFDLMFKKGWYTIETATKTKIEEEKRTVQDEKERPKESN